MTYTVLGLSAGSAGGNAEILLREALGALAATADVRIRLVRLDDLRLPATTGATAAADGAADTGSTDDAGWFWDRLLEADALVVSTPILTRSIPARLKLLVDQLLGPNADAAIVAEILRLRSAGEEPVFAFRADERVLKPRVAGFIAVGGALTPQWKTLALPTMHALTLSMQIAVVDQVLVGGAGTPKSVVLDPDALGRAAALGSHVGTELGRPFDDARYHGEPGLCPRCHLNVVELAGDRVSCATCGSRGRLSAGGSGSGGDEGGDGGTARTARIEWTDLDTSVISMAEKRAHFEEILDTARAHAQQQGLITERSAEYQTDRWVSRPAAPDRQGASS